MNTVPSIHGLVQPTDMGGFAQPLLSIAGLVKHFPLKKDLLRRGM